MPTHGKGLAAIEGKEYIGYKELAEATGLKISSIRRYNTNYGREGKPRLIPAPDFPGRWRANRQDIRDWITRKSRPGRGHRTDLQKGLGMLPEDKPPPSTNTPSTKQGREMIYNKMETLK